MTTCEQSGQGFAVPEDHVAHGVGTVRSHEHPE